MVNAHSATYPHVTLFSTSETNYLPWILLTVTSSTTTRFQSTSSSPILSWVLSPWKPIGRWSSRSIVSPASCCFTYLLSQSLDLIGKLGGHLLDHGFPTSHIQLCPVCLPLTSPCPVLELTYKLQTSSSQWRVSCAASQFYEGLCAVHQKS